MELSSLRIRVPRVPVAVQFTREGLIFILLSLAIGAAAVNTGNNVLYLIFSLMLGMIVVSGMMSRRMLSSVRVRVDFPPAVFAATESVCYVTVQNGKPRLPSLGVRFVAGGGAGFPQISRFFFYVPAGAEVHGFTQILFPRRGLYDLHEMEIQTRFPFSFFTKIRRYFSEQQVRVYPRVFDLSEDWLIRHADGFLFESPYRGDSHQILHLREYSPTDSSKRIHWKASARAPHFLVKEYQKEQGRDLYIYFDCYPLLKNQMPILDHAASLVASLAFLVKRRRLDATFVFADRSFSIGSRLTEMTDLLDHLAELAPGPARAAQLPSPESSAAVFVVRSRHVPGIQTPPAFAKVLTVEDALAALLPLQGPPPETL